MVKWFCQHSCQHSTIPCMFISWPWPWGQASFIKLLPQESYGVFAKYLIFADDLICRFQIGWAGPVENSNSSFPIDETFPQISWHFHPTSFPFITTARGIFCAIGRIRLGRIWLQQKSLSCLGRKEGLHWNGCILLLKFTCACVRLICRTIWKFTYITSASK